MSDRGPSSKAAKSSRDRIPVRFRPHHLMCLHFFWGEGYSTTFVENLLESLDRLEKGPGEVVEGPDDICVACPKRDDAACSSQAADSEIARLDRLALELTGLTPGDLFDFPRLRDDMPRLIDAWWREACERDCDCHSVCAPLIRKMMVASTGPLAVPPAEAETRDPSSARRRTDQPEALS